MTNPDNPVILSKMEKPRIVKEPTELLPFLFASWPETKKKQVRSWLKFKSVTVNGKVISQFNHPLKPGDKVGIRSDRYAVPHTRLTSGVQILHEDADIIVVEKPAGLLSIATDKEQNKTAYSQLTAYLRQGNPFSRERVWIVHRLDKDTSGLMVFAKNEASKRKLQDNWDRAKKQYQAVAEGLLDEDKGKLDSYLDESDPFKVRVGEKGENTRRAITHFKVLKRGAGRTLVELTLETGRRHQIRVQLAEIGHPIIGDGRYGAEKSPLRRTALHACALSFPHPTTGKTMSFTSPLPGELGALLVGKKNA